MEVHGGLWAGAGMGVDTQLADRLVLVQGVIRRMGHQHQLPQQQGERQQHPPGGAAVESGL